MKDAFRKVSDEVFVADKAIVRLGKEHIAFLKTQALISIRKRSRICAHRSGDDSVHEMLIAISADSYIRPHKHTRKVESFHIVEGKVDVVVFDDAGTIADVIELGDITTGRNFYYRLSDPMFHTLLIYNDFLVVHEVTGGPFVANETILAQFAPPENQEDHVRAYIAGIRRAVEARGRHK